DWAVSLGAGGVAQGMYPAKFTFDSNAAPSCANDFAVFPIDAPTGNTRANVVGTFTAGGPANGQQASITITPTGVAGVTLTLTASNTLNTGLNFLISATASTDAANLAAAINRNLSATALDEIVAVASGATVTVYALTPGNRVVLTDAENLTNFTWGAVTAGTNGSQASIVAFNQLYSGTGGTCGPTMNFTFPEFIFSYASGVGPVATSPTLSLDGKKVAYVENDANIGAILHVLTFASGSTEYGAGCAASNTGLLTPTCATAPVIPGSTALSTATDYMLPLGLVAANAATGAVGALDSFSSPFMHYGLDILYVGDNNGYLYSIYPTFTGTPAHAGGNFPVQLNTTTSAAPTSVTATAGAPGTVSVTLTGNTLAALQSVTISGVTANAGNNCTAADVAAIDGAQIVLAAGATFTFNATIPTATTGTGCTVTSATVSPGTNILSAPAVDAGVTGNIFVGDSSANLYEVTGAGVKQATLALGLNINGGIRGGPLVDSSKSTGFAVTACSTGTVGEVMAMNAGLTQFNFTSTTMTKGGEAGNTAGLDTNLDQNCTGTGFALYDPIVDARYFALGISSATAANNGEIIAAASGSAGQQVKTFQFISSVMQTGPYAGDKPQISNGAAIISPLTEFFNNTAVTGAVTALTATTTVVTVTAANTLAVNDMVSVSGVMAQGVNCTAADVAAINGSMFTVASATATQFTYDATVPAATSGCNLASATATGGPDYMFMGAAVTSTPNPAELYSFLSPAQALTLTSTAHNTADVAGGTSGMIIDNDGTGGQESNLYFGTLATSTTICGATAAYCAVKLTQSGFN
ncbi:MAG: hypothetical protein WA175_06405, partial [Candidatus Acidiferrales bacterium]